MTEPLTDRYLQAKRIAMAVMDAEVHEREVLIEREVGPDEALGREVRWMIAAIERTHTATLPYRTSETVDLSGHEAQATAPRHYRLLRRLGEGGMGVVYLAERGDGDFVQPVALKVLSASAEGSPLLLERFARERQLLARLEHPGIAHLLDGGALADGKPFIAMEYVEGERIDVWCARQALGLHERIALFLKVCAAVEYAHRNLIIHRDIKPANILVTKDGEPKLLDFGIARIVDDQLDVGITEIGQHALTLAYASPEQIEQQPLTTAVDVYALGVVLYQLTAGRRPFQHITTPHLLTNAIISGDVMPPSRSVMEAAKQSGNKLRRGRTVPADIDAIVLKAMRRKASERYTSVSEFAADLRRWQARRPVLARRGRQWYRARRFMQRNRWPLAAASMLLLSVLAGLGASLYALNQARTQEQLAEQRQHQLERMVQFQQSMFDSVDVDAMGHAMADAQQKQVQAALVAEPTHKEADTDSATPLNQAFARVDSTDIARNALDTYVVTHALDSLDRAFPGAPLLAADLRQSMARVLLNIGSYAHATTELRSVLATRSRIQPADDEQLLSTRLDLAKALERQGQIDEAAAMYAQASATAKAYSPTNELRIATEAGQARLMMTKGHPPQALAMQQRLVTELKPLVPSSDRGLMQLRRDLVDTLVQMGRLDQARDELEPLVALDRTVLGAENPETLRATLTLAKFMRSQGEFEHSLALASQVADVRERRLGAEHPDTLDARYVAATDATKLAQDPVAYAPIQARIEQVITAYSRLFGQDNPHTISAMTGMVALLSKEGDTASIQKQAMGYYTQAIAMEHTILDSHVRMLGPDHPRTLLARGSLANLLDKEGQYNDALTQAEQTLEGQRRVLASDDPIMLGTLSMIGDIEKDLGDWAGASTAYRKALTGRDHQMGPQDPQTIESASRLYEALTKLHDMGGSSAVRKRYMDPVVAMNPATLNASMRSERDNVLSLLRL